MCRNIKTLANFEPPATDDEIRASALQFVRKLSGSTRPSRANEAIFNEAVDEVTTVARRLIASLKTSGAAAQPGRRGAEGEETRGQALRLTCQAAGKMARQSGRRAIVGFTVKSGWAALVSLHGPADSPRVGSSVRVELSDPAEPDQRQPYHASFGTARAADDGLERLLRSTRQYGTQSVRAELQRCRDAGDTIDLAGAVVGGPRRPGHDCQRSHPDSRARGQIVPRGGGGRGRRLRNSVHHLARAQSLCGRHPDARPIRTGPESGAHRSQEDDIRGMADRAEVRGSCRVDPARRAGPGRHARDWQAGSATRRRGLAFALSRTERNRR